LHKTPGWLNIVAPDPPLDMDQRRPVVVTSEGSGEPAGSGWVKVVLAWLPVTLPLLWGIWQTVKKAAVLFR
jgi:hypothetical protein